jgi:hypothetical protein
MADDSKISGVSTGVHGPAAPSGHAIRRAVTIDEASQFRRRPSMNYLSNDTQFDGPRRRSSTISDYSLNEARRNLRTSTDGLLNPRPDGLGLHESEEASSWSSAPLAFAFLPAIGGVFFKNGGAVVTDVMLLCLAAIFLHWSVTQPWYETP